MNGLGDALPGFEIDMTAEEAAMFGEDWPRFLALLDARPSNAEPVQFRYETPGTLGLFDCARWLIAIHTAGRSADFDVRDLYPSPSTTE